MRALTFFGQNSVKLKQVHVLVYEMFLGHQKEDMKGFSRGESKRYQFLAVSPTHVQAKISHNKKSTTPTFQVATHFHPSHP